MSAALRRTGEALTPYQVQRVVLRSGWRPGT